MTYLSWILAWFPTLVMLMTLSSMWLIIYSHSLWGVLILIFSLYMFPLLVYKIHNYFYPLNEGISYLKGDNYSPWWGTHQIQLIYLAFPILETILRLIPNLFSIWLRLWGAKIGKGIYWSSKFNIADRSLIEIGDQVIIGHGIYIVSHVIKPKKDNLMLYVKKVIIEKNVFISSDCKIAPGAHVKSGTFIPFGSTIYPNIHLSSDDQDIPH